MKRIDDRNRLSIRRPDLVEEWDFDKNDRLAPQDVSYGSNQYVWWKCKKCGYGWSSKISNRAMLNRGFPCCTNKKVVPGVNDLATRNPTLAKDWHPTKNGDLTPAEVMLGTARKVWWTCPYGHEYQASVLHRGHGTNCPICNSGRQTSFAEKAIFYYVKKIYPDAIHRDVEVLGNRMELDIYIPSIRLAIEYDGAYWHSNEKSRIRENAKFDRCKELGINLLRIKEQEVGVDESSSRWTFFADPTGHNKNLDEVIIQLLERIDPQYSFWIRKTTWPRLSVEVNTDRDRFEILGSLMEKKMWSKEYPLLQKEWHSIKNENRTLDMFSPGSDTKVWWKCSVCGHEWMASVSHRVNGTGCVVCYHKRSKGEGHYLAKKICQFHKDGTFIKEWNCISDAARELAINHSNISMCAKGYRKSAGGYVWKYKT